MKGSEEYNHEVGKAGLRNINRFLYCRTSQSL